MNGNYSTACQVTGARPLDLSGLERGWRGMDVFFLINLFLFLLTTGDLIANVCVSALFLAVPRRLLSPLP